MEMEGADFAGALELLARKAGVDLDQFRTSKKRKGPSKERLHDALELAVKFYQLHMQKKKSAIEYIFKTRGLDKKTVLEFQIGYSPNNSRALVDFLGKKGFSELEIKQAGLSSVHRGQTVDMFRGRIMIPLHDGFGKTIGFTARLLEPNEYAPKYINTPSTLLYDKSRHVFGLHLAKKAIKDANFSVITEGNMDVVSSHQAGIRNVVATAGTAITEIQLKSLGRLSADVRLAFDQDRAGLAAAERAIPIASRAKVNLNIITVPSGKDPDELVRKDKKLWERAINSSQYALDWLIDRYKAKINLSTAQGKKEFSDVLISVIKNLGDEVEKDHYVKQIAEIIKVDTDAVRQKLKKTPVEKITYKKTKNLLPIEKDANGKQWRVAEDRLLALALMLPGTRAYLEIVSEAMFYSDNAKKVYEFLHKNPAFDGNAQDARQLQGVSDYVKILSVLFEELYGDVDMLELQYEAVRLRARIIQYFVKQQKTLLSAQLREDSANRKLLTEARELDKLLNKIRE
jgi:DNA primase